MQEQGDSAIRIARSNYRQIRLTGTLETNGRFSYRVYAKPLNADWRGFLLINSDAESDVGPLLTLNDVLDLLCACLRYEMD